MARYSVWMLGASNVTVSGGKSLSGLTQGDGTHLLGETIRLDTNAWTETFIRDGGRDSNFDDNDNNQRLDGAQTIDGNSYGNSTEVEAEYRITLRDPGTGETWDVLGYNLDNSNPQYGTIEGLAFVGPAGDFPPVGRDLVVDNAAEGPGSLGQPAIDAGDLVSPPCFTAGTRILTDRGYVPVEELRVGDFVQTHDAGAQPLRWIGSVVLSGAELRARPEFRPILIRSHALGPGQPARDMQVSPQHRILLRNWRTELHFAEAEMFAAATHLLDGHMIVRAPLAGPVQYFHIMCDSHHIIRAEGLETETFRPGPAALSGIPAASIAELTALFPGLSNFDNPAMPPARPLLKRHETRLAAGLSADMQGV